MSSKTAQAWGAGCLHGVALQIAVSFAVVGAIGACLVTAATVPLPRGVDRQFVALSAFIGAVLGSLALALLAAVVVMVRRARQLDAAFAPLGIRGRQYLTNGRQYHGQYGARQLHAYFYRGPTFDLYLSTPLRTRMGVAPRDRLVRTLSGLLNRQPLELDDPALAPLQVYAGDEAWGRRLLADPHARGALLRLVAGHSPGDRRFTYRQLIFQPGALLLRLHHTSPTAISGDNLAAWLRELSGLLRAAEALPAPIQPETASALERSSVTNRDAFNAPAMLIVGGLLVVLVVCSLVPVFVLLATSQP